MFQTLRPVTAVAMVCVLTSSAFAKRAAPPTINSIEQDGVRYSVPNDDGRRAYVRAWDVKENKKLWEADLFRTEIDPNLEEDVQWVFVKSMSLQDGKLKFVDEKGRSFTLDPKSREVEKAK
jgi:hypothetical protein